MPTIQETANTFRAGGVSIRFTLSLEDGTPIGDGSVEGDLFHFTRGQEEIMPILETALAGLAKGDKKEILLSPTADPGLKLDVSRLALSLGHSGQTLRLRIEVL